MNVEVLENVVDAIAKVEPTIHEQVRCYVLHKFYNHYARSDCVILLTNQLYFSAD